MRNRFALLSKPICVIAGRIATTVYSLRSNALS